MENTKEEVFKVFYNSSLEKLQNQEESKFEKIINNIKNHKLFTTVIVAFIMFATVNLAMIYSFMKILKNI